MKLFLHGFGRSTKTGLFCEASLTMMLVNMDSFVVGEMSHFFWVPLMLSFNSSPKQKEFMELVYGHINVIISSGKIFLHFFICVLKTYIILIRTLIEDGSSFQVIFGAFPISFITFTFYIWKR